MICCCCCASGPIEATMTLQRTGYVPGEHIVLNAQIKNNSSRSIDKCSVELEEVLIFYWDTLGNTLPNLFTNQISILAN